MLEALGLSCERGDRVLFNDVSFRLDAGELLHVKGVNGSGKTSLLRMLCGLVLPAAGEIRWQDGNIRKQKEEYNRELLYIGHHPGIKAELTALENLRLCCALSDAEITQEQAWQALAEIGLRGREDLPSKVLSQGQQRRVALARMLVSQARLWILDEPFTALDVKAVAQLEQVLGNHLEQGGSIVLTTHQDFTLAKGTLRMLQLGENQGIAA